MTDNEVREEVRARYAAAAAAVIAPTGRSPLELVDSDQCCAPSTLAGDEATCCSSTTEVGSAFGASLYPDAAHSELPVAAVAASLGCGNPIMVAELREGEIVVGGSGYGRGNLVVLAWAKGTNQRRSGLEGVADAGADSYGRGGVGWGNAEIADVCGPPATKQHCTSQAAFGEFREPPLALSVSTASAGIAIEIGPKRASSRRLAKVCEMPNRATSWPLTQRSRRAGG